MKQVKTLKSVGQYNTGSMIDVVADSEVEKLVKEGKPVTVLTQSRAKELLEAGYLEEVKDTKEVADDEPKAKPAAKTATKATETA